MGVWVLESGGRVDRRVQPDHAPNSKACMSVPFDCCAVFLLVHINGCL